MDIETMKALCEPSRCRIVSLLSQRAYCVSALATMLDLSAPAVSQHLRVLRDVGIVYCESTAIIPIIFRCKMPLTILQSSLRGCGPLHLP